MVKHTQTIRRQIAWVCLSVFDHFVGLALKGLNTKLFTEVYLRTCQKVTMDVFRENI